MTDYVNMKTVREICKSTGDKAFACQRGYELGYLQGKIDGIRKAEELFEPVHEALNKGKSNAN